MNILNDAANIFSWDSYAFWSVFVDDLTSSLSLLKKEKGLTMGFLLDCSDSEVEHVSFCVNNLFGESSYAFFFVPAVL